MLARRLGWLEASFAQAVRHRHAHLMIQPPRRGDDETTSRTTAGTADALHSDRSAIQHDSPDARLVRTVSWTREGWPCLVRVAPLGLSHCSNKEAGRVSDELSPCLCLLESLLPPTLLAAACAVLGCEHHPGCGCRRYRANQIRSTSIVSPRSGVDGVVGQDKPLDYTHNDFCQHDASDGLAKVEVRGRFVELSRDVEDRQLQMRESAFVVVAAV
jgi:hypothetical protein